MHKSECTLLNRNLSYGWLRGPKRIYQENRPCIPGVALHRAHRQGHRFPNIQHTIIAALRLPQTKGPAKTQRSSGLSTNKKPFRNSAPLKIPVYTSFLSIFILQLSTKFWGGAKLAICGESLVVIPETSVSPIRMQDKQTLIYI